ncbi:MAG: hypothetical protein ACRC0J_06745 [Shewanella oncorhynchi]
MCHPLLRLSCSGSAMAGKTLSNDRCRVNDTLPTNNSPQPLLVVKSQLVR